MTLKSTQKTNILLLALWGLCLLGYGIFTFELERFILPFGWAFLWHLTSMAFGQGLLRALNYHPADLGIRLSWAWLLGLGCSGVGVFCIFTWGLGYKETLWALWGSMGLVGLWGCLPALKSNDWQFDIPASWYWFGLVASFILLLAMVPPLFYDTAVYHLGLMTQMGLWGETLVYPHSSFASMPLLTEMAIATPYWLSEDPVVFNVGNSFGFLLLGFAASNVARVFFPKADNSGLLLAVLACPIAVFVATGGKPDWMTATAFAGAYFFWNVLVQEEKSSKATWILLGFMLGFLIGSKYHGLMFAVLFLVMTFFVPPWRRLLKEKNMFWTLGVLLFTGGLFLFRNAWVFQNPVYPFGAGFFGTSDWNMRTADLYQGIAERLHSVTDLFVLPWKISFWVTDGTMNDLVGPLWLFLLPLALLARPWPVPLKRFGIFVLLVTPLWLFSNAKVRYFAPLWLLLFWVCGWAWSYLNEQSEPMKRVGQGGVFALVLASLLWNLQADEALLVKRGAYVLGHQDKETYLKKNYGPYEAYEYVNKQLPEDAVVVLMGEPRLAYLKRRAIFSDVFVLPLHDQILSRHSSPQEIAAAFRKEGATHLIISRKGMYQLAEKWGYSRWSQEEQTQWTAFLNESTELQYEKNNWQVFKITTK